MKSIKKPPSFSDPTRQKCEGYWTLKHKTNKKWKDKQRFLRKVNKIEKELRRLNEIQEKRKGKDLYVKSYRGYAYSRIPGKRHEIVGSKEFYDVFKNKNRKARICWPEGYAKYYIGKHNFMPTKRFFNYVVSKISEISRRKGISGLKK